MGLRSGHERVAYLFRRFVEGKATGREVRELFFRVDRMEGGDALKKEILAVFARTAETAGQENAVDWDAMFSRILDREPGVRLRPSRRRTWLRAAAAVLLLVAGSMAYRHWRMRPLPLPAPSQVVDIAPGGNKAVLTLAGGKMIVLDSARIGQLASQSGIQVLKLDSGLLSYTPPGGDAKQGALAYNTLATPRGGQYRLTLSDGTRVWLNAESSIRYPMVFGDGERRVEMRGEVYFEVAHDEKHPFVVQVNGELIRDLGTAFNVNAYPDEPALKATLIEGSITMKNTVLRPGQQAVLTPAGRFTVRDDINPDNEVAWKNGFLAFGNADMETIMRKISRWYDIRVEYAPGVDNKQHFSGKIDRNLMLSEVLNGLQQARAHFRVEEGRRVVILP